MISTIPKLRRPRYHHAAARAAAAPTGETTKVGDVSPGRWLAVPALSLPEVVVWLKQCHVYQP